LIAPDTKLRRASYIRLTAASTSVNSNPVAPEITVATARRAISSNCAAPPIVLSQPVDDIPDGGGDLAYLVDDYGPDGVHDAVEGAEGLSLDKIEQGVDRGNSECQGGNGTSM
jgi:hypothetical protein